MTRLDGQRRKRTALHQVRQRPLHIPVWCTIVGTAPTPPTIPIVPALSVAVPHRSTGHVMPTFLSVRAVGLAAALVALGSPALAQRDGSQPDSLYTREHYIKSEYMIPMRDGVKLYTIVYT